MANRWTKDEDLLIINNYLKIKNKDISNILNRTIDAVQQRAAKLGLSTNHGRVNKHFVDSNYFENLNIENCYWAGFIAADGCINKRKMSKSLAIGLQKLDREHLEKFKSNISFSGNITEISRKAFSEEKTYHLSRLEIFDTKICDDLERNFNIISNKSLILQPPNLTGDLALSYICGYSDGDGSIGWGKSATCISGKYFIWQMAGTYQVLDWIKTKITEFCSPSCDISIIKSNNIFTLRYSGKEANRICSLFHKFNLPYLERKWRKIYE